MILELVGGGSDGERRSERRRREVVRWSRRGRGWVSFAYYFHCALLRNLNVVLLFFQLDVLREEVALLCRGPS